MGKWKKLNSFSRLWSTPDFIFQALNDKFSKVISGIAVKECISHELRDRKSLSKASLKMLGMELISVVSFYIGK